MKQFSMAYPDQHLIFMTISESKSGEYPTEIVPSAKVDYTNVSS